MARSSGRWLCHKCGNMFPGGSRFCRWCGRKFGGHNKTAYEGNVQMREEQQHFESVYRCSNCNSAMWWKWSIETPKYCENCGGKITKVIRIEREEFSIERLREHPLFNRNDKTTKRKSHRKERRMKKYNIKFSLNGRVIVRKADNIPNADELGKHIEMMLAPLDDMKASVTISNLEAEELETDD